MRARQQAGFHVNGSAFDCEADRAALIPSVVGQRCIGFAQGLDDNFRIEQAPQIVTRQQHNLIGRRSNGLDHKSLSFCYRAFKYIGLCDMTHWRIRSGCAAAMLVGSCQRGSERAAYKSLRVSPISASIRSSRSARSASSRRCLRATTIRQAPRANAAAVLPIEEDGPIERDSSVKRFVLLAMSDVIAASIRAIGAAGTPRPW